MRRRAITPPRAHQAPRSVTEFDGRIARWRAPVVRPRVAGDRDRIGSRRAGPAAATPPPMTTRRTPSVRDSYRMARARWSATRSAISRATCRRPHWAVDVGGARWGDRTGCDRQPWLRRPGDRWPDRRRWSRGSGGVARLAPSGSATTWRPRRDVVVTAQQVPSRRCWPNTCSDRGKRRSWRLGRRVGSLGAEPHRRRAGVVLDEGRDAQGASSIGPSRRWVIPRLTAILTDPSVGSTWPGMATPTATMSCPSSSRASSTRPTIWPTSASRSVGTACS